MFLRGCTRVVVCIGVLFRAVSGQYVLPTFDEAALFTPLDMCTDPVHNGPMAVSNEGRNNMESFHRNLVSTAERMKNDVRKELRKFRRKHIHCSRHEQMLNQVTVWDFVHADGNITTSNPVTQMFRNISILTNLMSVLASQGARQCCYDNQLIYDKVRNRIQGHWFIFNQHRGSVLPGDTCILNVQLIDTNSLTCDNIRDFIFTVLQLSTTMLEDARALAHQLYCLL